MDEMRGLASTVDKREAHRVRRGRSARHDVRMSRMQMAGTIFIIAALVLYGLFALLISTPSRGPPDRVIPGDVLDTVGDISWSNIGPATSPDPRYAGVFYYDPPTDKYVLFGGIDPEISFMPYVDTWTYDFSANSWQNITSAGAPLAFAPAYAYDSVDNLLLLYPILNMTSFSYDDTWCYNSTANAWTNLNATAGSPSGIGAGGAYDSQSEKFVVFGGMDIMTMTVTNETWSYDFTTNAWTNLTSPGSPLPRYYPNMVYDSESDRIIMYGGSYDDGSGTEIVLDDLWSYDLETNTWANMTPLAGPPSRAFASSVYDPVSDLMLVFGGMTMTEQLDDMWEYDYNNNTWSEVNQVTSPTARAYGMMAIDPVTELIVLFGGASNASGTETALGDTWCAQPGVVIPEFSSIVIPAVGGIVTVLFISGRAARPRRRGRQ